MLFTTPPAIHLGVLGVIHLWRAVFLMVGIAVAAWLTLLREPVRRDRGADSGTTAADQAGDARIAA